MSEPAAVPDVDAKAAGEPAPAVYRVGDHLCVITDGGICMKGRACSRYVTSYKLFTSTLLLASSQRTWWERWQRSPFLLMRRFAFLGPQRAQ
eukprot:1673355-Amphidinium_carterae.1